MDLCEFCGQPHLHSEFSDSQGCVETLPFSPKGKVRDRVRAQWARGLMLFSFLKAVYFMCTSVSRIRVHVPCAGRCPQGPEEDISFPVMELQTVVS